MLAFSQKETSLFSLPVCVPTPPVSLNRAFWHGLAHNFTRRTRVRGRVCPPLSRRVHG